MKSFALTILIILNVVLVAVNMCYICNALPRIEEYNNEGIVSFDYLGFIVGVLALITAIVVTWQLYNAIRVYKDVTRIDRKIKKTQKEIKTSWIADFSKATPLLIYMNGRDYDELISKGLEVLLEESDKDNLSYAIAMVFVEKGILCYSDNKDASATDRLAALIKSRIKEEEITDLLLRIEKNNFSWTLKVTSMVRDVLEYALSKHGSEKIHPWGGAG